MKNPLTSSNLSALPVTEWEDGVPRVLDTDLGAWLGYKDPRKIRDLISPTRGKDHLSALKRFGTVAQAAASYESGNGTLRETTA